METKTKTVNVRNVNGYEAHVALGEIVRDVTPSEKFPNGRIVLGIPTPTGNNKRGYMTVEEALEQKNALVSTDPKHYAAGFRVTDGIVTLKVGDVFNVAGVMADQRIADLNDNVKKYGDKRLPVAEAIVAMPESSCITAWYERKPTIKAWLKIGDRVRIGRRVFKIFPNNNDWITLKLEAR